MPDLREIETALEELVETLGQLRLVEGSAVASGGQEEYEAAVEALATLQQFFEEQL
jgi:hypothetical protein